MVSLNIFGVNARPWIFLTGEVIAAVQPLASRRCREKPTTRGSPFCLVNVAAGGLRTDRRSVVAAAYENVPMEIFGQDSVFRAASSFIVHASIKLPTTNRPFARTSRHFIVGVPSGSESGGRSRSSAMRYNATAAGCARLAHCRCVSCRNSRDAAIVQRRLTNAGRMRADVATIAYPNFVTRADCVTPFCS